MKGKDGGNGEDDKHSNRWKGKMGKMGKMASIVLDGREKWVKLGRR